MSLKKRDPSDDEQASEQESRREKRRRQREAARRQKALAESERKRRKEAEKSARRDESDAEPETPAKPAQKTPSAEKKKKTAKKPKAAGKPEAAERPKVAEKPKAKKPVRRRRGFAAGRGEGAKKVTGSAKRVTGSAQKVSGGIAAVVGEVLKLGREMLVIPLQLWLGVAELVGGVVLAIWLRGVLPALRLLLRFLRGLLHFGERQITPARAIGVVALVAIAALIASQWRDYSAISVGVDAYAGDVGAVAPAPEVSSAPAHDPHGPTMVILGVLAVLALFGAFAKRRRLAVWLVAIGIAVLAVSLIVDMPKGLDEGDAAVSYESASATLLSGFWLQIAAGAVLIACGLLLPRALRPAPAAASDANLGPSLIDRLVARARTTLEHRRARPKKTRRLPKRLRRPAAKGKVQGAGT